MHGITLPQWRALAQISQNESMTQRALAELIDTDPMTISGMLDRLEKRGLIERYRRSRRQPRQARTADAGGHGTGADGQGSRACACMKPR